MNAVRRQSAFLALPVVFYARLERSRWYRPISFGLTVVLVALASLRLYGTWTVTFAHLHGNAPT